jgi:TRAP-type C4-dicarboxylate transport system permease small subunit
VNPDRTRKLVNIVVGVMVFGIVGLILWVVVQLVARTN